MKGNLLTRQIEKIIIMSKNVIHKGQGICVLCSYSVKFYFPKWKYLLQIPFAEAFSF